MKISMSSIAMLAALATGMTMTGMAQTSGDNMPAKDNNMSASHSMKGSMDTMFAKKAAQGGMAEVQLGQLAVDKAQNPAVKQFGEKMVDDHSKANDQLKSVAAKDNITLPTQLSAKDEATKDRLSKLDGAAFDKAYVHDMVTDHEKDIAEFKHEANTGKNPDIKEFASTTLPTLQEHLKMVKEINSKMGGMSHSKSMKPMAGNPGAQ